MSGKVICFNSSSNYTTGLTGAQSNPVNPGWGRKGSAGVGRTSSPGAQDGQQRLLPCLACGTGHCRRASRAPPSLPVCSQEQHPTSPVPGRGSWVPKSCSAPWPVAACLGSIQRSFSGLGDSRGDYKVHAQQGKAMISS